MREEQHRNRQSRESYRPSPKITSQDFRAVATRLERIAASYFAITDQEVLLKAAAFLKHAADQQSAGNDN